MEKETKIYHHTYFRIESGYKWGEGMSHEAFEAFISEIILLFARAKWTVAPVSVGDCVDVIKGKTKLYVHPQEVSGACEDSLIPEVEAILAKGKTFSHYRTDTFGELFDLEGETLSAAYHTKDEETKRLICKFFSKPRDKRTVRMDLFELSEKVKIPTLKEYLGRYSDDTADRYIKEVFDSLVEEGRIISVGDLVMRKKDTDKQEESIF